MTAAPSTSPVRGRAPWGAAAPVALTIIAVLTTGLLVADAGGWWLVFSFARAGMPGDGGVIMIAEDSAASFGIATLVGEGGAAQLLFVGGLLFVISALALVVAAARGWRWLAVASLPAMAIALAGWSSDGTARLGYTTVVLREAPSQSTNDGQLAMSIAMAPVVGALLAAGFVIAVWWALSGWRSRRVASGDVRRPTWPASLRWVAVATLIALALPRVARWLRDAGRSLLGTPDLSIQGDEQLAQQTVYLLVVAVIVLLAFTAARARRNPVLSVGAALVLAALWIPAGWLFAVVVPDTWFNDTSVFVYWTIWFALGGLGMRMVAARAAAAPGAGPVTT